MKNSANGRRSSSIMAIGLSVGPVLLGAAFLANASEWLTFGGDAQRTGWARQEKILSKDSLRAFDLHWKLHLDNEPKELISLTAPLVIEDVFTARGVKDIVV